MKIYTKTGDKGTTALVGGTRVAKNHARIEAYGTADELISQLAFLRDLVDHKDTNAIILKIQEELMIVSAILAAEEESVISKLPKLNPDSIPFIEQQIDKLTNQLPELRSFLIPGGHQAVSVCHIARTICRRSERRIYDIKDKPDISQEVVTYFNRLSDYLFVLARWLSKYYKTQEIIWKPVLE